MKNLYFTMLVWSIRHAYGRATAEALCFPGDMLKEFYSEMTETQKTLLVRDLKEIEERYTSGQETRIFPKDGEVWVKLRMTFDESCHSVVKVKLEGKIFDVRGFWLNNKFYDIETCLQSLNPDIDSYINPDLIIKEN